MFRLKSCVAWQLKPCQPYGRSLLWGAAVAYIIVSRISLLFSCCFLTCCSGLSSDLNRQFADRYGPDPIVQVDDVTATVSRHSDIMATFASVVGTRSTSAFWFDAAEVGMNYVDEKCDAYMRDLFIISRQKGRVDGVLKALDKASNAVAVASSASKLALGILAQSFGLAEGINDSVLQSYLFEEIPGVVADKVRAGRLAYREEIEKPGKVRNYTEAIAFKVVRNYLSLCMPQTIEGKFLDNYIKATPVAQTPPTGPTPKSALFQTGNTNTNTSTNIDVQLK